jgi:hypothetical protein
VAFEVHVSVCSMGLWGGEKMYGVASFLHSWRLLL